MRYPDVVMATPFLHELSVPGEWAVLFRADEEELREDLLQLRNGARNRLVDVGWYPAGDPAGEFVIYMFVGDFSGEQLAEFRTRDRGELVRRLGVLMRHVLPNDAG